MTTAALAARPDTFKIGETIHRRHASGLYMDERTAPAVADAIAACRAARVSVRLFYGDSVTGKTWNEEWDVCGTVGASMGPCRAPLLIHNARSHGGGAILTACVVGILTGHGWRYRHPTFDNGHWTAAPISETHNGRAYAGASYRDGELIGRHATLAAAERHAAFMRGDRLRK